MRWLFWNPDDPAEAAQRRAIVQKVRRWWEAFEAKLDDLEALFANRAEWDLPDWMHRTLQAVDERLMWEFSSEGGRGHSLAITPETHRQLRPMVRTILEMAPALEGWSFHAYRQPTPPADAIRIVASRAGGDISGSTVEARLGRDNTIELCYHMPHASGGEDERALQQAFVASESLLGEEVLDKWIGSIEVAPRPGLLRRLARPGSTGVGLEALRERVTALISAVRDQLPPVPFYQRECPAQEEDEPVRYVMKLKPQEREDYARREDLLVAETMHLPWWEAAHGTPSMFRSERFSRCGETFCYVKIDPARALRAARWADRNDIEEDLDAALRRDGLGCVLGGGSGLRYSYADFVVTDTRRGVEAVRQVLNDGRIGPGAWILFFDRELADEWVSVHGRTPPPTV